MVKRVLIIGAGMAGLAAAAELIEGGVKPLVLEARGRCGGRIHTLRQADAAPIELGAEFVHGKPLEVDRFARKYHLAQRQVSDAHWKIDQGKFQTIGDFWEELSQVFDKIPKKGRDKSYCDFLREIKPLAPQEALATDFVEGFHAADPHRISVKSIATSEGASQEIEGTKQFRLVAGYAELVRAIEAYAVAHGAQILFHHAVSRIEWKPKSVLVSARTGDQVRRFEAGMAVITLPLGVLQSEAVIFDPPLIQKVQALRALAVGNVVKINLQLRPGLWPEEKEGFLHLASKHFPTWWKHRDVVTAWAGGPKADDLADRAPAEVINTTLESLAGMFGLEPDQVRHFVASAQFHDWRKDPFSRGAYTYIPPGARDAQKALGRSIKRTLFFAGEATAPEGFQGTVHGAIASGLRAAREVLRD
jgi:monoamine oxidase